MSRFVDDAINLLGAAENAMQQGHIPSDLSILISPEGGIRMVAGSDWPLDSLQAHHGARTAYRLSHKDAKVRIDGREGNRTCQFESEDTRARVRLLLGAAPNFSVLAMAG